MMGRQARASTQIMRLSEPHDLGSSCLLHTIGRYRTIGHIERTPGPCPRPAAVIFSSNHLSHSSIELNRAAALEKTWYDVCVYQPD